MGDCIVAVGDCNTAAGALDCTFGAEAYNDRIDLLRSTRDEDDIEGFDCAEVGLEEGAGEGTAKKSSPSNESAGFAGF